jgi:hypothetical protein
MPATNDIPGADPSVSRPAACGGIGWPDLPKDSAMVAKGDCIVRFVPALSTDPVPSVSLFHEVAVGDAIAHRDHRWTFPFATCEEATLGADWMTRHSKDVISVCRVGTPAAFGDLDCWMRVGLVEEQLEAEEEEDERRRLREEAVARAALIDTFLVDAGGQFGLDLRRFGAKAGFWRIMFREKWERERFRDWFRCQRPRFQEFATFLADHDAVALERLLLAEMLATERRIKAAGLGAGGRRPLRFWRGD